MLSLIRQVLNMYLFYLHNMLLPVAPESLAVKYKNQSKVINLINGEEINIQNRPGLCEISFKCLIPRRKYPFAVYERGFILLEHFTAAFYGLLNSKKPFLFVVKKTPRHYAVDLNMQVTMESYEILDDAVNSEDIVISVNLKQYASYGTASVEISENSEAVLTSQRDDFSEKPTGYIVKGGDNLWNIAKTVLGDGVRHKEIYELNREIIEAAATKNGRASSRQGQWIYPGTELRLP